jgi:hypothetical protein
MNQAIWLDNVGNVGNLETVRVKSIRPTMKDQVKDHINCVDDSKFFQLQYKWQLQRSLKRQLHLLGVQVD